MQVKCMNRERYLWIFTFYIHLHNLEKEDRLHELDPCHLQKITTSQASEEEKSDHSESVVDLTKMVDQIKIDDQEIHELAKQETSTKIICIECKKDNFKSEAGLKRHINQTHKQETNSKKFQCPKCAASFDKNNQLTRHVTKTKCAEK